MSGGKCQAGAGLEIFGAPGQSRLVHGEERLNLQPLARLFDLQLPVLGMCKKEWLSESVLVLHNHERLVHAFTCTHSHTRG